MAIKLSRAQRRTLYVMAQHPRGESYVPTGYRTAGADASRWYRTIDILVRAQLVRYVRGYAKLLYPAPSFVYEDSEREGVR